MSVIKKWNKERTEEMHDYRVFSTKRMIVSSSHFEGTHNMYVIESNDWVNIIALTPSYEIVCIRQYRAGTDEITLEIPGGMIDSGEEPLTAAKRELAEETGYISDNWFSLGKIAPNPAIQSNYCHSFVSFDCTSTGRVDFDTHEDIALQLLSIHELDSLFTSESINHALVSVAFHKLHLLCKSHSGSHFTEYAKRSRQ